MISKKEKAALRAAFLISVKELLKGNHEDAGSGDLRKIQTEYFPPESIRHP